MAGLNLLTQFLKHGRCCTGKNPIDPTSLQFTLTTFWMITHWPGSGSLIGTQMAGISSCYLVTAKLCSPNNRVPHFKWMPAASRVTGALVRLGSIVLQKSPSRLCEIEI